MASSSRSRSGPAATADAISTMRIVPYRRAPTRSWSQVVEAEELEAPSGPPSQVGLGAHTSPSRRCRLRRRSASHVCASSTFSTTLSGHATIRRPGRCAAPKRAQPDARYPTAPAADRIDPVAGTRPDTALKKVDPHRWRRSGHDLTPRTSRDTPPSAVTPRRTRLSRRLLQQRRCGHAQRGSGTLRESRPADPRARQGGASGREQTWPSGEVEQSVDGASDAR